MGLKKRLRGGMGMSRETGESKKKKRKHKNDKLDNVTFKPTSQK